MNRNTTISLRSRRFLRRSTLPWRRRASKKPRAMIVLPSRSCLDQITLLKSANRRHWVPRGQVMPTCQKTKIAASCEGRWFVST